ncbi:MAG: DnaJ domain-containing protein [Acidobacteria bacterium]|nr:DnaJ domain-containing protein [Acidobacteriota bacterium]
MNGNFSRISFPDVIRELHLKRRTGLLRLVQDKTLRAIFVEEGKLVFALSNLPQERLGDFLLRENRISREQYDQALLHPNSKQRMGKVLIELGFLSPEEADFYTKRQITEIILANFGWSQGEFTFEENTRAAHDVKLDLLTPNIILMGVRTITDENLIRGAVGPVAQKVQMSMEAPLQLMQATLDGTEGFLLSRITDSHSLDELVTMCGLPEAMVLRVIYGLICAGILDSDYPRPMMDGSRPASIHSQAAPARATPPPPPSKSSAAATIPVSGPNTASQPPLSTPSSAEPVMAEKDARDDLKKIQYINSLKTTTYYTVLGVDPSAREADIKKAYYALAKKYHPDRFRQYGAPDILTDAEQVFAKIGEAYEKLKDLDFRRRYDDFLGVGASSVTSSMSSAPPPPPTPSATHNPYKAASSAPSSPPPTTSSSGHGSSGFGKPMSPPPAASSSGHGSSGFGKPMSPPPAASSSGHGSSGFGKPMSPAPPPASSDASRVGHSTSNQSRPEGGPPTSNMPKPNLSPAPSSPPTGNMPKPDFGSTTGGGVGFTSGSGTPVAPMSPLEVAQRNYNYGRAALERKDYLLATKYLREAIKYAPENVSYRLHLAEVCSQNPKLRKEAEEHLLQAVRIDPRNVDALLLLGKVYKNGGLDKSAKTQFEAVLKIQPNHPAALQALGRNADEEPKAEAPKQPGPEAKPADKLKDISGSFLNRLFRRG